MKFISEDYRNFEEEDLFGRVRFAVGIERLVNSAQHPLVIAVDGEWGTGKTFFLKALRHRLQTSGHPVIFLDAFTRDHHADAFLVIAAQVANAITNFHLSDEIRQDYLQTAGAVGKKLLLAGASIGAKIATAGLIDSQELGKALQAGIEEASNQALALVQAAVQEVSTQDDAMTALKEQLTSLPAKFATDQVNPKPIVFIIDELDRCRPNFALDIIEVAKHFFNVEGLHFVLGTNLRALASSVRTIYGADLDGERYLSRFIHASITLREDDVMMKRNAIKAVVVRRLGDFGLNTSAVFFDSIADYLAAASDVLKINLRDTQKVASVVALATNFNINTNSISTQLLAALALIKILDPIAFDEAVAGRLTPERANGVLSFERWARADDYGLIRTSDIFQALLTDETSDEFSSVRKWFRGVNYRSHRDVVPSYAKNFIDRMWQANIQA